MDHFELLPTNYLQPKLIVLPMQLMKFELLALNPKLKLVLRAAQFLRQQ